MSLTIRVKSYRNETPAVPRFCEFPEEGGTLGRTGDATFTLDDPKKLISRKHASVFRRGSAWCYTDCGTNPSLVNGRALNPGQEAELNEGDVILVGEYVLEVSLRPSEVFPSNPVYGGDPGQDWSTSTLSGIDILAPDGQAPAAGVGARQTGAAAAPAGYLGSAPDHVQPIHQPWQDSPGLGGQIIPEGANFFDPPTQLPTARRTAPPPAAASAPPAAPPHAVRSPAPFPGPALAEAQAAAPPRAAPTPAARAVTPAVPPVVNAAAPAHRATGNAGTARPVGAAATPGIPPEQVDILRALLEGMGLTGKVKVPVESAAALARMAGRALNESVSGTKSILQARAVARNEFTQTERTMLAETGNNPLKFIPEVEMIFEQALITPRRGYIPLPEALREAFEDLRAHELAVIAGMEGAVRGILARLDPHALESQAPEGGLGGFLPGQRKARLWDAFVAAHAELSHSSGDEFQRVLEAAFSKAYQAQIDRIHPKTSR